MAFIRYANAVTVQPAVSQRGWGNIRKTAAAPSRDIMAQAAEILGGPLDPDRYLLTHSTIVASVDVESAPNVRLGKVRVGSKTINRKYSDYLIKSACSQWVNNNGDSWARQVLLAAYPTFIGGHNFVEHYQVEEASKGRLVDAVARDIGDSVYVDILVATDRKHTQLIKDIESMKTSTLSMGCTCEETTCSKCGNVAVDETELCDCIRYAKRDSFIDEQGQRRIIAELCGHPSIDPHGGVHFIEASWVATPAFTGAVLRNILDPKQVSSTKARDIQAVLNTPPAAWGGPTRVASANLKAFEDFEDSSGVDDAKKPAPAAPKNPLDDAAEEIEKTITDKAVKKLKEQVQEQSPDEALDDPIGTNDNVVKEGYDRAVNTLTKTASSDVAFLDGLAALDQAHGVRLSRDVYRAVLKAGSVSNYPSLNHFLRACIHAVGRQVQPAEARVMARIGSMLSRRESTQRKENRDG